MSGWAMRKGDTFFQPNKKRFMILCNNYLYWAINKEAKYPIGRLNLYNKHVYISKHGTTLRIKSLNKERIFNFGDDDIASTWSEALSKHLF